MIIFKIIKHGVMVLWLRHCHCLVVKALDSQSRGPMFRTIRWPKVDSALHPSEVDQMSTRNFWELSSKK